MVTNGDLTQLLKDADPTNLETPPSSTEIQAMRRRVMATQVTARPRRSPMIVSALVVSVAVAGLVAVGLGQRGRWHEPPQAAEAPPSIDRQQLQFETPGGTK